MLLLDASSIITLVREAKEGAPDVLRGRHTIPLAFYEAGNFVWKERVLRKAISAQEASVLLDAFTRALNLMVLSPLAIGELRDVYELAERTGLTSYDAAYLYVAIRDGLALVTEDGELAEKARELGVRVLSAEELLRET